MVGVIYLQLRLGEQFLEISVFFNRMMTGYWMKFDLMMIERDDFLQLRLGEHFLEIMIAMKIWIRVIVRWQPSI